jgi:hypothetical protein
MQGDLERLEKQLQVLKQGLKQDPTNLELANRYWKAVVLAQSGRYVHDAYRSGRSRRVSALRLSHGLTRSCFRAAERAPRGTF